MRIINILPGPAGLFFEQNSRRGQSLVAELRWAGHDVLFVPVLFPLENTNAEEARETPLFGGAARIYAQHCMPFLAKHAPNRFWRLFDNPKLSRYVAMRVLKSPERFANFIYDALGGEGGDQAGEIAVLCRWLEQKPRADIIYLSTPFLLGIAPMLKRVLRTPVACLMSTELEDLANIKGPAGNAVLARMRAAINGADGFIATSVFHATRVHTRLGAPRSAIYTVHPGVNADEIDTRKTRVRPERPCVGIFVKENDLTALAYAAKVASRILALRPDVLVRVVPDFPKPTHSKDLRAASAIFTELLEIGADVAESPTTERTRRQLYETFSVFAPIHSKPFPAFDMHVLETLALGIPAVLPNSGANPEIAALSDGVTLYDATDKKGTAPAGAIVEALLIVYAREKESRLETKARYSIEHCFSMPRMAQETALALQAIIDAAAPTLRTVPQRNRRKATAGQMQ